MITKPGSGAFVAPRPATVAGDAADFSWQTVALGDRVVDDAGRDRRCSPRRPTASIAAHRRLPAPGPAARTRRSPRAGAGRAQAGRLGRCRRCPGVAGAARGGSPGEAGGDVTAGGRADRQRRAGRAHPRLPRARRRPATPVLVETPDLPGRAGRGQGGRAAATGRADGPRRRPARPAGGGVRRHRRAGLLLPADPAQPHRRHPHPRAPRAQVLEVARAAGAFVIEDDYARYLTAARRRRRWCPGRARHGRAHPLADQDPVAEHAGRRRSSRAGPAAHRLRAAQLVESFFVARPLQETALEFVGSPAWRRHLAAVHAEIATRRDALAAALAPGCPARSPTCCRSAACTCGYGCRRRPTRRALVEAARRHGVLVSPGRIYYPAEPPGPHIRVTHIAAAHVAELAEGVRRCRGRRAARSTRRDRGSEARSGASPAAYSGREAGVDERPRRAGARLREHLRRRDRRRRAELARRAGPVAARARC